MTYDELYQAIYQYSLNEEASFLENIPNFVKSAEDDIFKACQIADLRKASTANLTTSNQFLSLPLDFLAPYSLSVVDDGSHYFLLYKQDDFIREAYPNPNVTGRPQYYALLDDDSFILGPTPDDSYQVELHYYFQPASIVSAQISWLGTNAPNTLLYGSLLHAAIYAKSDEDMIKSYNDQFQRAISELQIISEGRARKDIYRTENVRAKL